MVKNEIIVESVVSQGLGVRATAKKYGVLTDIYTSTYRESHSGLEIDLDLLGITFKHDKPYHPMSDNEIESKFPGLADAHVGREKADEIIASVWRMAQWTMSDN